MDSGICFICYYTLMNNLQLWLQLMHTGGTTADTKQAILVQKKIHLKSIILHKECCKNEITDQCAL
jgi:hypothetical protein